MPFSLVKTIASLMLFFVFSSPSKGEEIRKISGERQGFVGLRQEEGIWIVEKSIIAGDGWQDVAWTKRLNSELKARKLFDSITGEIATQNLLSFSQVQKIALASGVVWETKEKWSDEWEKNSVLGLMPM